MALRCPAGSSDCHPQTDSVDHSAPPREDHAGTEQQAQRRGGPLGDFPARIRSVSLTFLFTWGKADGKVLHRQCPTLLSLIEVSSTTFRASSRLLKPRWGTSSATSRSTITSFQTLTSTTSTPVPAGTACAAINPIGRDGKCTGTRRSASASMKSLFAWV